MSNPDFKIEKYKVENVYFHLTYRASYYLEFHKSSSSQMFIKS